MTSTKLQALDALSAALAFLRPPGCLRRLSGADLEGMTIERDDALQRASRATERIFSAMKLLDEL